MFEALKAAVEERMRLARDATPGPWLVMADPLDPEIGHMYWVHSPTHGGVTQDMSEGGVAVERTEDEGGRADAEHIAANDPAFVLRQCERDIDLLRRYTEELAESEGRMTRDEIWEHNGRMELLRELVRDLAEVYQINLGVSDDS